MSNFVSQFKMSETNLVQNETTEPDIVTTRFQEQNIKTESSILLPDFSEQDAKDYELFKAQFKKCVHTRTLDKA